MLADEGLLRKAQHHARNNGRIRTLVNRYQNACKLAVGPNPDRSAYWTQKSGYLEAQLRQALDVLALQPDKPLKPKRRSRPHRRQS